jgi:hypothetical protein
MVTFIWNTLKNDHATELSSLPRIDTTLLLMRDWLQNNFVSHPQVSNALATLKILDSTPSSAFLRRNDINPDDITRLTWSLVSSRPSIYELFFETLLEINENTPPHGLIIRLLQLAWILSPKNPAGNSINSNPTKPPLNEVHLVPTPLNKSDPIGHHIPNNPTPIFSQTTPRHQSHTTSKQHTQENTPTTKPLMSINVEDSPQPQNNTHLKLVPLMSFYVPPLRQPHIPQPKRLSTTSHRPRLYSDVCRQPPTQIGSPRMAIPHHRSTQHRQQPIHQPVDPPTSQPTNTSSSINDPLPPDFTPAFNTELIELS